MNKIIVFTKGKIFRNILLLCFMGIGIFFRFYNFGNVPAGVNQDEAFGAYEAYSLLYYGMDSAGYHNPVYLVTWGSGMSVLNSYLMMPFIKLFGLNTFSIRLPQAILGTISLYFVFSFTRKIYDDRTGLTALGLAAICPWHVLMSRWGLDCNLAPGLLIIAAYFFLLGIEKNQYFILSAFFYGLSLYAYATLWSIVPVILTGELLYLILTKKIHFSFSLAISALLLMILAIPLILFVFINLGYLNEIRTSWISIPKLHYFRAGEISFQNIPENFMNLFRILISQKDNLPWNSANGYGFLGYMTLILSCLGIPGLILDIKKETGNSGARYNRKVILLINFLVPFFFSGLIFVNINRINILFIPMIILASIGFSKIKKGIISVGVAVYFVWFAVSFGRYYFTDFNRQINYSFNVGLDEALEMAASKSDKICLSSDIPYPCVLFYQKIPVTDYRNSASYIYYQTAFEPVSFSNYSYSFDPTQPDSNNAYIIGDETDMKPFEENDFTINNFRRFRVAHK